MVESLPAAVHPNNQNIHRSVEEESSQPQHPPQLQPLSQNNEENDEEEEYHDAVAAATALVGEAVLDSPEAPQRNLRNLDPPMTSMLQSPELKATSGTAAGRSSAAATTASSEMLSVGIMAQGFAWVRKQRESRNRLYLQNQAERQLKKIREAQRVEDSFGTNGDSLRSTDSAPTFQNASFFSARSSDSKSDEDEDSNNSKDPTKPSISGDGVTVKLELADESDDFIPPVRIEPEPDLDDNPYILTVDQRQQIAGQVLPQGIAYCKWKRVYCLARDGDSFDVCLRLCADHKKSLLVVRTTRSEVFGGYADAPWQPHGHGGCNFFGGSTACLFRLDTERNVKPYKWSGANHYVQLCDVSHKRLAFGGGGTEGMFGLCLQEDFQLGSTGHCATFDNEPLCDSGNFEIVDMEVFAFLTGQF